MKESTCFGYSVFLLSLLAIIACSEVSEAQSPASPDAEKVRLKTRAAFLDAVTDKTLVYVNEAGQIDERIKVRIYESGHFNGFGLLDDDFSGDWNWQGDMWCRKIKGKTYAPGEDCQVLHLQGDVLIVTRGQGQSETVRYKIVDPNPSKVIGSLMRRPA